MAEHLQNQTELKHSLKGELFFERWKMCAGLGMCVFYLEEVVNMVLGSIIPHVGVGVLPHHVIDGVHDSSHLLDRKGGRRNMGNSNITRNY